MMYNGQMVLLEINLCQTNELAADAHVSFGHPQFQID